MNINNRNLLNFSRKAKDYFSFLSLYDLNYTLFNPHCIQFESTLYSINIYHDIQSYEIGLELEFNHEIEIFSFSELLRLVNTKQSENYRNYIAYSEENIVQGLIQLANLFKENISIDLLNDDQLYNRLKNQRDFWIQNYAIDVQLELARKKLTVYWIKQDYKKVIEILEPLIEYLTNIEKQKLIYAKKHLK